MCLSSGTAERLLQLKSFFFAQPFLLVLLLLLVRFSLCVYSWNLKEHSRVEKKAGETDDALLSGFPSRAHTDNTHTRRNRKGGERKGFYSPTTLCVPGTGTFFPDLNSLSVFFVNARLETKWTQRSRAKLGPKEMHTSTRSESEKERRTHEEAQSDGEEEEEFRLDTLLDSHANNKTTRQLWLKKALLPCCKPISPHSSWKFKIHKNFQWIYYHF